MMDYPENNELLTDAIQQSHLFLEANRLRSRQLPQHPTLEHPGNFLNTYSRTSSAYILSPL